MRFRSLILFFRKKRYREAIYLHADLRHITEAAWWERTYRWLFKAEYCDGDGKMANSRRKLRHTLRWVTILAALWFFIESLTAWNIFNG